MTDKWLNEVISNCENVKFHRYVKINPYELLFRLKELQRLRKRESLALPREPSIDGVCCCGGIPQTAADGTCFYCKRKVQVKS